MSLRCNIAKKATIRSSCYSIPIKYQQFSENIFPNEEWRFGDSEVSMSYLDAQPGMKDGKLT